MGDDSAGLLGNATLNIIGIVISTVLPLLLLRYFRNQEKKTTEKQKEQRTALDENTKKLEDLAKQGVREQKEQTQKMIEGLEARHIKTIKELEDNYGKIQTTMIESLKHEKDIAHKELAADFRKYMLDATEELKNEDKRIVEDIRKEGLIRDQRLIDEMRRHVDLKNSEILIKVSAMADSIKDLDGKIKQVSDNVAGVNIKQVEMHKNQEVMIISLQKRADLVNGNVAAIRNDIVDIHEEIDSLYVKNNSPRSAASTATEMQKRKRRSADKRHQIREKTLSDESDINGIGPNSLY
jgi:uncharacterized protein YcgL (UPF0745 family)